MRSVFYSQVENDFAQQHVLERRDGSGAVDGVVALEGLEEVGVGRLPVLLLGGVDDPCGDRQRFRRRQRAAKLQRASTTQSRRRSAFTAVSSNCVAFSEWLASIK